VYLFRVEIFLLCAGLLCLRRQYLYQHNLVREDAFLARACEKAAGSFSCWDFIHYLDFCHRRRYDVGVLFLGPVDRLICEAKDLKGSIDPLESSLIDVLRASG
jgi:hypothetical protein